jgi:hypothetical protein
MINFLHFKKSNQYADLICLISVVVLLIIWVLPNTISSRNTLLITGGVSGLVVIIKSHFFMSRTWQEVTPLYLFALLFLWALVHFFFFSLNPELSLKELKGVWFRSVLGAITAIGLSIVLRNNESLHPYFFISLFAITFINLGVYAWLSFDAGHLLLPAEFINKFVFKKIEAAVFSVIAISIACANIVYLMSKKMDLKNTRHLIYWFLGIVSAILSSVVANTKNGVAVALGLCVLLAITLVFKASFGRGASKLKLLLPAIFIIMVIVGGWKVHNQFASQGWNTLFEDVQISSQIDKHNFWRFNSQHWKKVEGEDFPRNSKGLLVAGNTYERISWATQGIILISQYPMGYGSINQSFVGMLNHAKIKQQLESQTHSGWIDFGLAFGIPGLLILLLTFTSIIYRGHVLGNQFGLIGVWLILGFMPLGVIAEINYKHNFEILLFFIAFAAASTIGIRNKKSKDDVLS